MTGNAMWRCVFALLAIALVAAKPNEKVAVFPLEGVNVAPGVVRAVTDVLEDELRQRGFEVVEWEPVYQRLHLLEAVPIPPPPPTAPAPPPPTPVTPETDPEQPVPPADASAPPQPPPPPATRPVPPPLVPPVAPSTPLSDLTEAEKAEIAREAGCDGYIDGSLVKLGSEIRVSVYKRDLDGEIVDEREMPAKTDDDLVNVLERIAQAFGEDKSVDETLDLDNATKAETQNLPERFRLEKNFGAIIGQAFGVDDSMNYFTFVAFDVRLEINDLMVELNAGFAFGERDSTQLLVDIGAAYYLTHTPVSPYIGAGVGVFLGDRIESDDPTPSPGSYDGGDGDSNVGFEAYPVLGIEFLRQSSIRLHIDLRYSFSWGPEGDLGHGPLVLVGINF